MPPTVADQRRPRDAGGVEHIPAVKGEVQHVFQEFLTGGLAVPRQLWDDHVVASRQPLEERRLVEQPGDVVQEYHASA
jgi:hypothetical protein